MNESGEKRTLSKAKFEEKKKKEQIVKLKTDGQMQFKS